MAYYALIIGSEHLFTKRVYPKHKPTNSIMRVKGKVQIPYERPVKPGEIKDVLLSSYASKHYDTQTLEMKMHVNSTKKYIDATEGVMWFHDGECDGLSMFGSIQSSHDHTYY